MPLALLVLACKPVDRAYPANEVSLVVSSTELDIGPVALDGTATGKVYVWNDAGDGATLSAEAFGTGFSVVGGPWPLVGLTQITITVTFSPESIKTATGTLVLEAGPADAAVALVGLVTTDWDGDGFDTVLEDGTECDDPDASSINPKAEELCDCDDRDASINPDAQELWYDGIDQDCDGNDLDQDGDGANVTRDCNDDNRDQDPDNPETVDGEGVDEDCDGIADETLAPNKLIVTELLLEPDTAPNVYGQFVEVYNASGLTVGLTGWTLERSDGTSGVVSPVTVASHDYVVLCPSSAVDDIPCDAVVQPWPTFSANVDSLTLFADALDANPQDDLTWDASDWPIAAGASTMLAVDPDLLANDDPSDWCVAPKPWAAGSDDGSPGLANDCP